VGEQKWSRFQLVMLEESRPVAFWSGVPDRRGATRIDVYIGDDINVLAVCEILLGLAVELLPDELKPKGLVIRETLKEYIREDEESDIPW